MGPYNRVTPTERSHNKMPICMKSPGCVYFVSKGVVQQSAEVALGKEGGGLTQTVLGIRKKYKDEGGCESQFSEGL